jgi:DNA-directed RNA polymerase subunit RPC12/RpoP
MSLEHTAYIETLAHVNCGQCDGYWGLSDVTKEDLTETEWSCPHCGHRKQMGEFVDASEG